MQNICSYGYAHNLNVNHTTPLNDNFQDSKENNSTSTRGDKYSTSNIINNDLFSINGDRLEVFGISINIDDLIILIMLFFMFRENQVDYSIIIILALILFDQN